MISSHEKQFYFIIEISFMLCYLRVPFIRDGLLSTDRVDKTNIDTPRPLQNVNILEVGCGAGILTEVGVENFSKILHLIQK